MEACVWVGAGVGSARLQACIEELGISAKSCHSEMTGVSVPIDGKQRSTSRSWH